MFFGRDGSKFCVHIRKQAVKSFVLQPNAQRIIHESRKSAWSCNLTSLLYQKCIEAKRNLFYSHPVILLLGSLVVNG